MVRHGPQHLQVICPEGVRVGDTILIDTTPPKHRHANGVCVLSDRPLIGALRQRVANLDLEVPLDSEQLRTLLGPTSLTERTTDFSLRLIFDCFDIDSVIALTTAVLMERRIVLRSHSVSACTIVGESLRLIISPLRYCGVCVYLSRCYCRRSRKYVLLRAITHHHSLCASSPGMPHFCLALNFRLWKGPCPFCAEFRAM